MSEPTVTLRFPKRIHTRAKIEAMGRGMSLQDFVEQAVEDSLGRKAPPRTVNPQVTERIAALPERSRKLVAAFVDLLGAAPDFQLVALEKYVHGMNAVFKQFDKRHFDERRERPTK